MIARRHVHWSLVFLLVFAQEAAVVHLAAHAAERVGDRQTSSHSSDVYCPKCSQFASFGSSPPSTFTVFILTATRDERVEVVASPSGTRSVAPYQSRAPPV